MNLYLCESLRRQNSVGETKTPVHTKQFFAATGRVTCCVTCAQGVICRRDVLQQHVAYNVQRPQGKTYCLTTDQNADSPNILGLHFRIKLYNSKLKKPAKFKKGNQKKPLQHSGVNIT